MPSSSESEDDEVFRSICDPTLSSVYNKKDSKIEEREQEMMKVEEESKDKREAFVILRKIQRCTAIKESLIIRGHGLGSSEKIRRPANVVSKRKEMDLPSSISKFLAKELSGILDKKIIASTNDPISGFCSEDKRAFHLVSNVVIDTSIVDKTKEKKRGHNKQRSRKKSYYDKKELASRCKSVAVTPEWILNKSGEYPWPHPKNIRYLDEYRMECKKPNGVIVAVPKTDTSRCTKVSNKVQKSEVRSEGSIREKDKMGQKNDMFNQNKTYNNGSGVMNT